MDEGKEREKGEESLIRARSRGRDPRSMEGNKCACIVGTHISSMLASPCVYLLYGLFFFFAHHMYQLLSGNVIVSAFFNVCAYIFFSLSLCYFFHTIVCFLLEAYILMTWWATFIFRIVWTMRGWATLTKYLRSVFYTFLLYFWAVASTAAKQRKAEENTTPQSLNVLTSSIVQVWGIGVKQPRFVGPRDRNSLLQLFPRSYRFPYVA